MCVLAMSWLARATILKLLILIRHLLSAVKTVLATLLYLALTHDYFGSSSRGTELKPQVKSFIR